MQLRKACLALFVFAAVLSHAGAGEKDEFVIAAPVKKIKPALIRVMLDEGYRLASESDSQLVFEKEGPSTLKMTVAVEYTFLEGADSTAIRWAVYGIWHQPSRSRTALSGWGKTVRKWLERCNARVQGGTPQTGSGQK